MSAENIFTKVKNEIDLVEYLEKDGATFTKKGNKYVGSLKTRDGHSLHVSPPTYRCYNPSHRGTIIDYVMHRDSLDTEIEAAIQLAEEYDIEYEKIEYSDEEKQEMSEKKRLQLLFDSFIEFSHEKLMRAANQDKLDYLLDRGLTIANIEENRIGYIGYNGSTYFKQEGYTVDDLKALGLVKAEATSLDDFYMGDRYTIPYKKNGRYCFLETRDAGEGKIKYMDLHKHEFVNPDVIETRFWGMDNLEALIWHNIRKPKLENHVSKRAVIQRSKQGWRYKKPRILLCEGIIDGMLAQQHFEDKGWTVISTSGIAMNDEKFIRLRDLLFKTLSPEIVICFDNDRDGVAAAREWGEALQDNLFYALSDNEIETLSTQEGIKQELEKMPDDFNAFIKIATLPKPNDIKKVDLGDYIADGKTNEALYQIKSARTLRQYGQWLDDLPYRFGDDRNFTPKTLSDEIITDGYYPLSIGDAVYIYDKGIYIDKEMEMRKIIGSKLGFLRTPQKVNTVMRDLYSQYEVDADEYFRTDYINFKNGLLYPGEDKIVPHTPHIPMLAQIPHNYNPKADAPENFHRFLTQVVEEDDVLVIYEVIGYSLHADSSMDKCIILNGSGANGKSTLLRVIRHIVGDNNCSTTTLHQLSDSPYGAAELHGKLACISAELPSRALMNSETFKAFCGGDKITARRIYGSPFDYEPYATLIYACNEVPDSYDTTEGLYRKLLIVDFPNHFDGSTNRDDLVASLTTPEECEGIITASILAYKAAKERGSFTISEKSIDKLEQHRMDNDPALRFFDECAKSTEDASHVVKSAEVYNTYKVWLEYTEGHGFRHKQRPLSKNKFKMKVLQHFGGKVLYKDNVRLDGGNPTTAYVGLQLTKSIDQLELENDIKRMNEEPIDANPEIDFG